MSTRPPAPPPLIPGFEYVRHLGSGGFADVHLYEQKLLGRKVAVKVLLARELMDDALTNFTNEANLMAQLSNHPSIVSVYQAGVSEDGRPFIVMEYCSRPNLQVRYRAARFSTAETLRVGVQIAGAVETAHRAGILHRDIKPANILFTDYGRPALTDFGIAAATGSGAQAGLSVPWAPPESFVADVVGDERSDVYSLAATLYTVLAGRTPFELPGASNSSADVMARIQTGKLPPVGRADVSASLERVLATALAREPDGRYHSAIEFARALQRLQVELGLQATTVDVVEDAPDVVEHEEDEGLTRIRNVVTIDAQAPAKDGERTEPTARVTGRVATDPSGFAPRNFQPASLPAPSAPPVEDTQLRAAPAAAVEVPAQAPTSVVQGRRGRAVWLTLLVLGVVVAAVFTVIGLTGGRQLPSASHTQIATTAEPVDPAPTAVSVPTVRGLTGVVRGSRATFTWTNPDPRDGDSYLWRLVEPGVKHTFAVITAASVSLPVAQHGSTCIEVVLRRANGRSAEESVQGCAK